eukprot:209374-Rhodomonas_salina.2
MGNQHHQLASRERDWRPANATTVSACCHSLVRTRNDIGLEKYRSSESRLEQGGTNHEQVLAHTLPEVCVLVMRVRTPGFLLVAAYALSVPGSA